jgi:imidazolonepropionase-like amidohydrolase
MSQIYCFGNKGLGCVNRCNEFRSLRPGLSADLILVEGNPAENIDDTRNVREVFMRGKQVDRESL